jgi:HSP20 family protein
MSLVRRNSDVFVPATVDNFLDRFFNDAFVQNKNSFSPKVDIAETDKAFELYVAVPGFDKKDFNIDLKKGKLTISGERKFENEKKEKNYYSIQTEYGKFSRSFQLPDNVKEKGIGASYENGILEITIPKDEAKKIASKIEVK